MGSYLSSFSLYSSTAATAMTDYSVHKSKIMVITTDGSLLIYATPLTAANAVSEAEGAICDADHIVFDAFPPVIPPEAELEVGKLYFVLAAEELGRQVTGADMVAMAMKASMALQKATQKQGRRIRRPRVMPAADFGGGEFACGEGMVEKKKRYLKRRGGRLKRMLSTVHEVDEE